MPKNISWRKLVKKFSHFSFDGPFSGGRHLFMIREDLKVHIPNLHRGDISAHLLKEILNQSDITLEDWNNA